MSGKQITKKFNGDGILVIDKCCSHVQQQWDSKNKPQGIIPREAGYLIASIQKV